MRTRWEDTQVRVYQDGREAGVYTLTEFTFEPLIETEPRKYQGKSVPDLDSHYNGERLSMTFDLSERAADFQLVFEKFRKGIIDRTAAGRIDIVASRVRPVTGDAKAFRFSNVHPVPSERASEGRSTMQTVTAQAESRELIQ